MPLNWYEGFSLPQIVENTFGKTSNIWKDRGFRGPGKPGMAKNRGFPGFSGTGDPRKPTLVPYHVGHLILFPSLLQEIGNNHVTDSLCSAPKNVPENYRRSLVTAFVKAVKLQWTLLCLQKKEKQRTTASF